MNEAAFCVRANSALAASADRQIETMTGQRTKLVNALAQIRSLAK